jgi:hypothetical protein
MDLWKVETSQITKDFWFFLSVNVSSKLKRATLVFQPATTEDIFIATLIVKISALDNSSEWFYLSNLFA